MGILAYFPLSDKPRLTFISEVINPKDLTISPENFEHRKQEAIERQEALINYVTQNTECRSRILIGYFGEKTGNCGKCDVCLELNKGVLSEKEFNGITEIIKPLLALKTLTIKELIDLCEGYNDTKVVKTVNWLVDNGVIVLQGHDLYRWRDNDGGK
jgi:ATP-dependent DNA helicase RecQ